MDGSKGKAVATSAPPPYSQSNNDVPRYQASSTPLTIDAKTLGMTAKFPPLFKCHYSREEEFYYLGPVSREERYFAFSASAKMYASMQPLHLHNGPTERDPIIARVTQKNVRSNDFAAIVTLHDLANPLAAGEDISFDRPEGSRANVLRFRMRVGPKNLEEEFQWRRSSGNEVKEIARHSIGLKLVRVTGPRIGAGGSRRSRAPGFASDGLEVVAVMAPRTNLGIANDLQFSFLGTGLDGALGARWETVAVITGFWLFGISRRRDKD
ncbi:hypothetical protein CkaCkLH20_05550 [Colletotrichum karsti]|uniref:Uncharacterized protein n=1 Tax=Colletotrichum karsti TaxID=1095194 RepID=A0A9P6LHW0_9PEZI|nr:uncharacterized protein CkaCkLH20_05550 [Colletotrichum karsti]KAF9876704.1 hypothetical protein CkaCkLH20_05550 [Colletotrichum karsti]